MHQTDDVQIRIMRQLVGPGTFRWDFRESYASMAEKLGLDEETVRRGVNRAREIGFLRDVQLVPNPSLLECECSGITLDVADPEKKPSAISQLSRVEGVIIILNLIGKSLRVTFYHRGQSGYSETTRRISAAGDSECRIRKGRDFPPCDLKPNATDWKIISALRKYPRRPVSELASEVGVSTKTIARRLAVMTCKKAFFLLPELDYRKFPGVASSILITVSDEAMKARIDKQVLARLNPRLVIYRTDTKVSSAFTMLCVNMSEAEDFYRWVSRLDGVHDSQMDYLREIILPKGWLDKEINRHVRDLTQHAHT